ncbi:MAG: hypothetical protein JXQ65_08750 [Candidatus Marinimicrobia bacterium]|nr:hypothetical protein [Candidatus Neomarinimicrobiota bacterium]
MINLKGPRNNRGPGQYQSAFDRSIDCQNCFSQFFALSYTWQKYPILLTKYKV